uniref:Uncharacterized protein n=1 Tax=Peronospora matthiolae TaxID=2874970 RepID=A0AAV1VFU4_9STRA
MLSKLLSHGPSARPTVDAVVQWGHTMCETSVAQKAVLVVFSLRNLGMIRSATEFVKASVGVYTGVHNGKVEMIKKCGLHAESKGVTIPAFELDPQGALAVAPGSDVEGSVVLAIEAFAEVQRCIV